MSYAKFCRLEQEAETSHDLSGSGSISTLTKKMKVDSGNKATTAVRPETMYDDPTAEDSTFYDTG